MQKRFIFVDMAGGSVIEKEVPTKYKILGGRGLTSCFLSDEVDPKCDPLSSDNKLIIALGLFGGSIIANSGRLSIGAKSPLTGGIKESNVGGTAGQLIASHDIQAIVIENCNKSQAKYLEISDEGIFLKDLKEDVYMGNYELFALFQKRFNNKLGILSVGPAGMLQRLSAGIAGSDLEGKPTRYAGRGGLGAVMGSKGLRAIIIHPSKKKRPEATPALKEAAKVFAKSAANSEGAQFLRAFGTAGVLGVAHELGSLPTRSFSKGKYPDFPNMDGAKIVEIQKERNGKTGHRCMPGCVVACSNIYCDTKGEHVTSALEYETLVLMGSNLEINDLDAIARFDHACDDMGVDSIELGGTIGVAMDEGLVEYGDKEKVLEIIYSTGKKTEDGDLYGNGVVYIGRTIGAKRIPATLGQGHPAHDPRTLNGVGVTYVTSPMGADHTAGLVFDPAKEGAVEASREHQIYAMLCDTLGLCLFVSLTVDDIANVYNAFLEKSFSADAIREKALEILRLESRFNEKAGLPAIENRMSDIFRTEALPETGNLFDTNYEEMRNIFESGSVVS